MKKSKFLLNLGVILFFVLFLVGCTTNNKSSGNVSLDFLVTPEQIRMYSDIQLVELNEIGDRAMAMVEWRNKKYDDLTKMSEEDNKIQEEIHIEVMDALNLGKNIIDKSAIENIFNQLRELEGTYLDSVDSFKEFKEDVILRIDLFDDEGMNSPGSLEDPYDPTFNVLQDGNMIIVKLILPESENQTITQRNYIKVKLPEELKAELEKLAKD